METTPALYTAAEVAKHRLEQFIETATNNFPQEQVWGFYAYLLKQAKKYKLPAEVKYSAYWNDEIEADKSINNYLAQYGYHGIKENKP
jgi:indole-3-glycerol phosphate synthase